MKKPGTDELFLQTGVLTAIIHQINLHQISKMMLRHQMILINGCVVRLRESRNYHSLAVMYFYRQDLLTQGIMGCVGSESYRFPP